MSAGTTPPRSKAQRSARPQSTEPRSTVPLRIGLDMRPLEAGFKAHAGRGTGRYTDELTQALLRMQEQWEDAPLHIDLVRPAAPSVLHQKIRELMPFGKRTFESQFIYPRQVAATGVDLMHFFSHGDAPSRPAVKHVVSVLDLIPLRFPHLYQAKKSNLRFKFARYLELQAIRSASGIFAISEATKRDIVSLLGVPAEKIQVTPLATTAQFQAEQKLPGALPERIAQLAGPYLLYVGGIDPRKNIRFLIRLLSELRSRKGVQIPPLVLAGEIRSDDQYPGLRAAIRDAGLAEHVIELGRVSEQELIALYQHATAFLFPSLYEGFGLPVLEAMACGAPVLAADNSSVPEVLGAAGVLLEDNNLQAWCEAVEAVLENQAFAAELSARGIAQSKSFSWQKTAELTLEGYQRFLGHHISYPQSSRVQDAKYA